MPQQTRRAILGALIVSPLALGARAATTHQVEIAGFKYSPAELNVAVGDTVVFTNTDGAPHTATALDGSFDTKRLRRGNSAEVVIEKAGTFEYKCTFHPNMRGKIIAS